MKLTARVCSFLQPLDLEFKLFCHEFWMIYKGFVIPKRIAELAQIRLGQILNGKLVDASVQTFANGWQKQQLDLKQVTLLQVIGQHNILFG